MKEKFTNINLSEPKRRYYSNECGLDNCPECGSILIEEKCTVVLCVKSESYQAEFLTNSTGSHFCDNCPVVVFDIETVQQTAQLAIRSGKNIRYIIAGIVDLDSIPKEKKHLEIGCDDNPVPLVHFLPDLNLKTIISDKKPGRNDPCSCGSGFKYKKCCGK